MFFSGIYDCYGPFLFVVIAAANAAIVDLITSGGHFSKGTYRLTRDIPNSMIYCTNNNLYVFSSNH